MVALGGFSGKLVDAETKQAFTEFAKGSRHYAEVEPRTDYSIRVRREHAGDAQHVRCSFEVDGVDLGYFLNEIDASQLIGTWACKAGISTTKCLRFDKPNVSSAGNGRSMMGTVKVHFYEAIPGGQIKLSNFISRVPKGRMSTPTAKTAKAAARSRTGKQVESFNVDEVCKDYETGRRLTTIIIRYCTTFGLIYAGILPKPPRWEEARLEAAASGQPMMTDPDLAFGVPSKIRGNACYGGDTQLSEATEVKLFDLAYLKDADED